jgi:hypothetical protein
LFSIGEIASIAASYARIAAAPIRHATIITRGIKHAPKLSNDWHFAKLNSVFGWGNPPCHHGLVILIHFLCCQNGGGGFSFRPPQANSLIV